MKLQRADRSDSALSETVRQWRAIMNRDRAFDGRFVFAVRSTGVYCRPSCPARRPSRHQVLFFPAPRAAADAGFRPCRRCRPDQTHPQKALVQRICVAIDAHPDSAARLKELGAAVGMSPFHVQRIFKRTMGISPRQYAMARRLHHFKQNVRNGHDVTSALYEAGYGSSSRLYEESNARLGMTPATYQSGGKGMLISYSISNSPLGRVLIAGTRRGLCFLSLGSSDKPLEQALRKEYPKAEIKREPMALKDWVGVVLSHLKGRQAALDLPLDLQATAFQWKVWKQLQRIPLGETRTYSQIARSLGKPRANRAVARACATNRVSIVIPCHRVVREDGGLGGYRWGLQRKQALLEMEKSAAS